MATSIVDYIARKLAAMFLAPDICEELGVLSTEVKRRMTEKLDAEEVSAPVVLPVQISHAHDLGVACERCGGMMRRTGSCWSCPTCFNSTGCG